MEPIRANQSLKLDRASKEAKAITASNPNYKAPASQSGKRNQLPRLPTTKSLLESFRLSQEVKAIATTSNKKKFDDYLPETLRWFLRVFCSNLYHGEFTYLFPTYHEMLNQYRKEINEYEIGRAKTSVPDKFSDYGFSSVRARLCDRYIINHLSHEVLTDEQLQSKYYWVLTQAESQNKYPYYFCLDIDSAVATNHKEPERIYSDKNLPRTSSKLNRLINEVIDVLSPASAMLFTSSSGKLEKRHLYFLLDSDVSGQVELDELKELVSVALSPVLSKYGIEGWKNGEIEFYPMESKGFILPLGLNSKYMKRSGKTFRVYCKEGKEKDDAGKWKKVYHKPSIYHSLEYLMKQDAEDKIHRISSEQVIGWRKLERVLVPPRVQKAKLRVQKRQQEAILKDTSHLEFDVSQIPMDESYSTTEFLKTTILPKLLWNYFPGKIDEVDAEMRLRDWFEKQLKGSGRGLDKWLDTTNKHKSYLGLFQFYCKHFKPEQYYKHGLAKFKPKNRTEELYRQLLDYVATAPFKLPEKNAGMHRIYAFRFLCRLMTCIHPQYNHSRRIEVTEDEGIFTYKVNIKKAFVDSWGIRGLKRDGLEKLVYGFKKLEVMRIPPFWAPGRYSRKWEVYLPFNFFNCAESYQLEWDGLQVMKKYFKDEDLLRICNERNLAKLKDEFSRL